MENDQAQQPVTPAKRGKLPLGGVILLIIGALWLLNNLGFSWADNIWIPVVIIVIGLYTITKK